MKAFSVFALFFCSVVMVGQVAPVVADHYRAKAAVESAVAYKAEREASMVVACATGKTNVIMHNGVWCGK